MTFPREATCCFWSRRTTSIAARPCGAVDLIVVKTSRGLKYMCRTHRNDYQKTGRIRGRAGADKFYSTAHYRTRKFVGIQNVNLGKK